MITDAVKEYLFRKGFGFVGYSCLIVHLLCGLGLTVYIAVLRLSDSESGTFSCTVDAKKSNTVHKKQVDQSCFTKYDQAYNSPLPFYGFVLLSIGSGVLVSVIYSQIVSNRVDEIESSHQRQNDGEAQSQGQNRTVYVFYAYFFHFVIRACLRTIFTVLECTIMLKTPNIKLTTEMTYLPVQESGSQLTL